MPDISFIICAHNCLELTKSMLDSLFRYTDLENRELILVDDASTDGTPEYLRAIGGSAIVLTNQSNQGFSKSNNLEGGGLSYNETNLRKFVTHLDKNKLVYGGLGLLATVSLIALLF